MLNLQERVVRDAVPRQLLIGGMWVAGSSKRSFAVTNPATGLELVRVAEAEPQDAQMAVDAAAEAFPEFSATTARYRAGILRKVHTQLMERSDEFSQLLTLETGKGLLEARAEVEYAADFLSWFSDEALRIDGGYAVDGLLPGTKIISKHPVGPCLLVTPWNFPLGMAARKIGPALAAGCTVVIKPPELAPLTTMLFAQLLAEQGIGRGVVNVVTTTDPATVVEPLLSGSRLAKLSFTGSTSVGIRLLGTCAKQVIRTSMELGGNAAFMVFDDADLDAAAAGAVDAKFRNAGQACTAANRLLVHESVAEQFTQRLIKAMRTLKADRENPAARTLGPLIDSRARDKVEGLVQDAMQHGAQLIAGGRSLPGPGYFFEPTVLSNVGPGARIHAEEIFGPVAVISTFATEAEAIARANDTDSGLVSYVYTRDLDRSQRMIQSLQTGMMGLNVGTVSNASAPFGGWKRSGLGREGGIEGIGEYLETKYTLTASPSYENLLRATPERIEGDTP